MQRKARTFATGAALAVALTGGLTACTSSGDAGSSGAGDTQGDATATTGQAPPGKYRTLPEPCGAPGRDRLKEMLPGTASASGPEESADASPYEGQASVTYDTDRRVGCTWQSTTSLGSRNLSVDFERVVSYDPEVGDDEETELVYNERARKAGISPSATPPDVESTEPEDGEDGGDEGNGDEPAGGGEESGEPGADGSADGESGDPDETALPGSPSAEASLPPRTLDGIGDAAFLDDRLVTTESGRATHRDVTLVFRTANVLVTVEYSQSVADAYRTPDSAELQEQAQQLARQLAERFDDN